jgi:beta-N-acetylglucosaminidase
MKKAKNVKKINIVLIISIFFVAFILVPIAFFSLNIFATTGNNVNFISNSSSNLKKNVNPIIIEDILQQNTSVKITEEISIEEIDLEYTTEYKNNSKLSKGTIQVIQEGKDGKQKVVAVKKYENEELMSEEIVSDTITKASINKIVEIGTGSGKNTYVAKVGDSGYVTSNTLTVRLEPNSDSSKVCTLRKDAEVKILEILDNWYYISSTERKGYITKDCITNKNPNASEESSSSSEYSKEELLKKLDFNMDLNEPSNFSLEQFKKVLSNDSNDKNNIFEDNAEYFYYAEKQYKINGIFLAAVAIHESGWGTSTIAKNKYNLFGYGAVDNNPYGGAYSFESYNEGIDMLARVFVKYYLNPDGTEIYDGNIANGKFYSGNTISSVNKKYASDSNWANSVYKWMKYLYNNL